MKNKLLKTIIMLSKCFLYGLVLQTLLLNLVLALNANGQYKNIEEVRVTLSADQLSLNQFFKEVQRQTPFKFSYEHRDVDRQQSVTFAKKEGPVIDFLREAAQQSQLSFRQVNHGIDVLKRKGSGVELVTLVDITITGTVSDEAGEPLPGASVTMAGSTTGTVTDIEGNYTITVPDGSTLVFSFIGFESMRVPVDNQSQINITLKTDMSSLEEVVVVGYGTQQKRDITGAVGHVKGDEIRNLPVAGVDRALQGRAAGVVIAANSGAPGSGTTVRIRGNSSIYGNNEPLYVVDGIPLGENVGGMEQIVNPNDVESIEILKDASAAAIYGSRGANGVVLITTKKGISGAPKVMFNSYYGVKNAWRRPQLANATEFARTHLLAHENGGTTPIPAIAAVAPETWGQGTDWWDVVNQTGSVQNHDFSIMGGTDKVTYSTSLAYFKDEGFIRTSEFDRITFRLNTEYKLSKKIKFGTNLSLIHNSQRGINENTGEGGGVVASVFQLDPISPVYKTPEQLQREAEIEGINVNNPFNRYAQSLFTNRNNLAGRLSRNNERDTDLRILGNIYAELELLDGLVFRSDLGLHLRNEDRNNFSPQYWIGPNDFLEESQVSRRNRKNTDIVFNNTLTYHKNFNGHDLTIMGGMTAEEFYFEEMYAQRFDTPTNNESMWYLNAANRLGNAMGFAEKNTLLSYLGRVQYSLHEKYLLTASIRADGSSRFAEGNRWGVFPSMSAGWRISEENFFSDATGTWLNDFKIRGGWGQIGNQRIENNAYINVLAGNDRDRYAFGPNEQMFPALRPENIGNPMIQWETVEQSNIGFDAALFNGKFTISADYFIKDTKNNLLRLPQPLYVGSPSPWANAGQIRNSGYELTLGYRNYDKEFRYSINGNITFLRNEVISLATGDAIPGGESRAGQSTRTQVGHPIAAFYGWVTDGIFQNEEEVAAGNQPNARPGDFRFKDINGDGVINDQDRTFIGNPNPDYTFGMNFMFEYRNFDLNIFMQGQYGNDVFLYEKYFSYTGDGAYNTIAGLADMAWRGEGTSNTQPIISSSVANNNFRVSDWYLSDGSYLRVKNVQLGFNLPPAVFSRYGVAGLRFWVGAENLLTFTNFEGLDPEIGVNHGTLSSGMNQYAYPVGRTYMAGLTINF